MNVTKIAVAGVGALGRHHARILSQMPGVELVAVADPNQEQGKTIAGQLGTRWVSNYADVLDEVEGVTIAVPTWLHRSVAATCLERGKSVMVEKPLASNVTDAQFLAELAHKRGLILQVGHVERFNPAWQQAVRQVRSPKYIRCERFSPFAFRSMDIGVVHDVMIHDIDLVLQLADSEVSGLEAFGISILGGKEDAVQARIRFRNGCIADLTANRVSPVTARRTQIWDTDGCTNVDLHLRTVTRYAVGELFRNGQNMHQRGLSPGADIAMLKQQIIGGVIDVRNIEVQEQDALTAELSEFIRSIRGETQPSVDGFQAVRCLKTAEQILTSVERHCWDGASTGPAGPNLFYPLETTRKAA